MNKDQLLSELRREGKPAVVDFWAPWCAPCRASMPVLEKLGEEFKSQVQFRTINADEEQELLRELRIMAIPTLLTVDASGELSRITGAQSSENYRRLFESLAAGESAAKPGITPFNRILRLAAGAVLVVVGLQNSILWLQLLGLVIVFTSVYDRCPIWRALTARFKGE